MLKKYKALSKRTIAIVVGVTLLATTTGYVYFKNTKSNKVDSEMVSREREYIVKRGNLTAGTSGSGILKFQTINQNFQEPVVIDEVFVKEGERVSKGDKIASISQEFINDKLKELNIQMDQANATLNSAKNNKQSSVLTQNKTWDDRVQASKTQYENERGSILNNINGLNGKLSDVTTKIEEIRKQIEELSQKTDENVLEIEELKAYESTLNAEKSTIESELNSSNEGLKILDNNRNNELNSESKEASQNSEINNLTNSGLDDAIKIAQKEVDKVKEEISNVNKLKESGVLYAEADGVVLALSCTSGATTMIETPIVTIGESDKVLAEITLSQNDITKIEEEQDVYITVSAFQDEKFNGKVKYINLKPNTQGNSTNYSVTVEIDKKDFNLLDGMTVNAQFIVKEVKDALILSNKAITLKDGKQIVNVRQEDGTLKELEITTGFSDGKSSEILGGLSEGDTVVVGGQ